MVTKAAKKTKYGLRIYFSYNLRLFSLTAFFCVVSLTFAEEKQHFDIKPTSLDKALNAFAMQTNSEILFTPEVVGSKESSGLQGHYTQQEALEIILAGKGLIYRKSNQHIYLVQSDQK